MKWYIFCLIYVLVISSVENADNFSFPGIVNSITNQLADMFLVPRKHVERKKIILDKDTNVNDTASYVKPKPTEATTIVDPALLGPAYTWADWRFKMSTRIVPAKKPTTDEPLVSVEQSDENEEEPSESSDSYDDVFGEK